MKTFKQFLSENPAINTYWNKTRIRNDISNKVRDDIRKEPEKHKNIAGDYYAHKQGDNTAYFRKHDNDIKEVSVVTKNHVQKVVDKGETGDAKHIHNFMKHHAEQHGKISTDTENTQGSKKLWSSLIKSKPENKTFHVVNTKTKEEHPVDHTNIDKESDSIWGKTADKRNIKVEMRHKKD